MRLSLTRSESIQLTTIITLRQRSLLWLLLSVRLGDYIVNSWTFIFTGSTGNWPIFWIFRSLSSGTRPWTLPLPTLDFLWPPQVQGWPGSLIILVKDATLRIMFNLDGPTITSKSHTHPSHSQTSRLLTSSLSLGCIWECSRIHQILSLLVLNIWIVGYLLTHWKTSGSWWGPAYSLNVFPWWN